MWFSTGSLRDKWNGTHLSDSCSLEKETVQFELNLLCLSLGFSAICKASSDNHFAFLHFFFWMIVFITAVKVLHLICQQIWKTQKWPQDWKRSVFIPIPNKGNAKECSNYHTIAPISHTSKAMLKILQGRLQQCVKQELPDVQIWFRKGRGTRDQIANIHWIIEKTREFQKTSTTVSLTT